MASKYTDVITEITNIATETVVYANTAMRVGTVMSDMTALSQKVWRFRWSNAVCALQSSVWPQRSMVSTTTDLSQC